MSANILTTNVMSVPAAGTNADDENADADVPIADVIRPHFTRRYRYVTKGPTRSIFRYR